MYDVLIVGEGIASFSAALHAAQKKLAVQVLADPAQGEQAEGERISYPGYPGKGRAQLLAHMRKQAEEAGAVVVEARNRLESIFFRQEGNHEIFVLGDGEGNAYEGRSVIVASGKKPRRLGIPGEAELLGKGVAYDIRGEPPLFEGKVVAVVGAGETGLDAALQLSRRAGKVYVLEIGDRPQGDEQAREKLMQAKNAELVVNAAVQKILGAETVRGVVFTDKTTGEERELAADMVVVAIGASPDSDFLKGFCDLNQWGEVIINPRTNATSHVGVFAAGEVTDIPEKEAIISAGEGAKAALSCAKWLTQQKL